jgi:hypothetical protein
VSRRVFLHVGVPKSGTSYVQRVMRQEKARWISEKGLLFPGASWRQQMLAVRDLREMKPRQRARGAWPRLVKELAAWPGDSVVSMEWLCAAEPRHIRRAVADLAPAEVHVVFTVRDLGRTLPAAWQEFVQNRRDWSWDHFLSAVVARDTSQGSPGRIFWSQQDVPAQLARWVEGVGQDRVHVVTLPRSGSDPAVLWQRLTEVLDLGDFRLSGGHTGANESLGLESVEMLRRLNPLLKEARISKVTYNAVLKGGLAKHVLAGRRTESKLRLPAAHQAAVHELAREQVEGIEASGVEVVGDLDELLVEPPPADLETGSPDGSRELSEAGVLTAALTGLVTVVRRWDDLDEDKELLNEERDRLRRRLVAVEDQLERERRRTARLRAELEGLQAHPLRTAARTRLRPLRRAVESRRHAPAGDEVAVISP